MHFQRLVARAGAAVVVALFVAATCFAGPARAGGVALALNLPDENPVHRDFAGGIVAEAASRWRMLRPQMEPNESVRCAAERTCLLKHAVLRGADHLLLVGVAALGPREFVVSIQVFEAATGKELLGYSDVQTAGEDARASGRRLAAAQLARVQGIPPQEPERVVEAPPPRNAPVEPVVLPRALGWAGVGTMGASVALGLATATFGFVALASGEPELPQGGLEAIAIGGAAATGALLAAGLGLVVTDVLAPP